MISTTLRRLLTGMAVVAAVALVSAPVALAQAPPAPADNPKCGGVGGLMHHSLADFVGGSKGKNWVSIQRVSPIQGSPTNAANNGFHKICTRMGLTATGSPATMPSIDGDGLPDNADLFQYNGKDGIVASYRCDQLLSSSQWDEGSAVEIRPNLSNGTAGTVSLIVPGVECSQRYAVYRLGGGKGTNLFPIPLSTTCSDRVCLCSQLNLPAGSSFALNHAAAGQFDDFLCGSVIDPTAPLELGEAARITSTFGTTPGQPLNCLVGGLPCPATPSTNYPAPLIY